MSVLPFGQRSITSCHGYFVTSGKSHIGDLRCMKHEKEGGDVQSVIGYLELTL